MGVKCSRFALLWPWRRQVCQGKESRKPNNGPHISSTATTSSIAERSVIVRHNGPALRPFYFTFYSVTFPCRVSNGWSSNAERSGDCVGQRAICTSPGPTRWAFATQDQKYQAHVVLEVEHVTTSCTKSNLKSCFHVQVAFMFDLYWGSVLRDEVWSPSWPLVSDKIFKLLSCTLSRVGRLEDICSVCSGSRGYWGTGTWKNSQKAAAEGYR